MTTTMYTSHSNTTEAPIVLALPDVVMLVPRHLDTEVAELAGEWSEYHQQNEQALAADHPVAEMVQNEDLRRWDDFVSATAPKLTTREDAMQVLRDLAVAIDRTWPGQAPHPTLMAPRDGVLACARLLASLASE